MSAGVMGLQIALGLGMVGLAVSVLFLRNLMASAVALAGFSLLLALEFYVLQAPDVAIAEAGIGAGLTTAIFMVAIRAVTAKPRKAAAPAAPEAAIPEPRNPGLPPEPPPGTLAGVAPAEEARPDAGNAEQAHPTDEPVAEARQDAAPPEAESAAPEVPNVPEVPDVPTVPEVPEAPENPGPLPPEKEAP